HSLQSAAVRQPLYRCRVKEGRDKEQTDPPVPQKSRGTRSVSGHSSAPGHQVYRCRPRYVRRLCIDAETHAAPGMSVVRIRECSARENQPDASFGECDLLCPFVIESP